MNAVSSLQAGDCGRASPTGGYSDSSAWSAPGESSVLEYERKAETASVGERFASSGYPAAAARRCSDSRFSK